MAEEALRDRGAFRVSVPSRARVTAAYLTARHSSEVTVPAQSIALLIVLLSGAVLAIQAPLNATLSRAIGGPVNAALASFLVGTVALAAVVLVGRSSPDVAALKALPWWAWAGGLCGAIFVSGAAYAAPLDHYGAFGITRQAITGGRVLGVALVVAGAVLVRRG